MTMNSESEINLDHAVSVYPNPVKDQLQVDITGVLQNSLVTITDVNGTVVSTKEMNGMNSIDMTMHPAGLYIVRIKTMEGIVTRKILKYD
jgi:lysyl endopeptidase